MTLFYALREFFNEHPLEKPRPLLALSGGPDSIALFYALLELGLKPLCAHVDHGWREESSDEAEALKELVTSYDLPFFLHKLDIEGTNLEERCREARLEFFSEVYEAESADALLLGHHSDDRKETILKRIFEGAKLNKLSPMPPESHYGAMRILRPLLTFSKVELTSWLDSRDIPYLEDATNKDERFLRARMRQTLIPTLEEQFGKKIGPSLLLLADRLEELTEYLDRKVVPALESLSDGPLGICLKIQLIEPIELRHLFSNLADRLDVTLSKEQIEILTRLCIEKDSNKRVEVNGSPWVYDRGYLFILKAQDSEIAVESGEVKQMTWKDLWASRGPLKKPDESFEYRFVDQTMRCINGKPLRDWYNENRVPTFLREKIGVLVKDDQIVHDYLTGKKL